MPAITVHQWLPEWEDVEFDALEFRRRPAGEFYLFSMDARQLKALTGISRRSSATGKARDRDLGIQRRHDVPRSKEIAEYTRHGFPWSALSDERKESGDFDDLKKPGWLPTAIVVNILTPEDTAEGQSIHRQDVIEVEPGAGGDLAELRLPLGSGAEDWEPRLAHPLSVIDGQHRLWAFEDDAPSGFQLPVVAFHGLDIAWQAYLFYTINIKPKKINTSLAFDLYPLLRTADWLERFEGHSVYRESRAQELTEALWSYPESPWYRRINMLGEPGVRQVTQASWIRSLLASLIKSSEGKGVRIGGLFGAPVGSHHLTLPWNRAQQAAFLVYIWTALRDGVRDSTEIWAYEVRLQTARDPEIDPAFGGRFSLINTDQGVRGYLSVVNDICVVAADKLRLRDWHGGEVADGLSESAIHESLQALRRRKAGTFLDEVGRTLADFDWRTSATPGLDETVRQNKARFRGGTGYRELRNELLQFLSASAESREVADAADEVLNRTGLI